MTLNTQETAEAIESIKRASKEGGAISCLYSLDVIEGILDVLCNIQVMGDVLKREFERTAKKSCLENCGMEFGTAYFNFKEAVTIAEPLMKLKGN